jgi:D-inositol-3-phosphate glycosyltransferase
MGVTTHSEMKPPDVKNDLAVSLLTGGSDPPYVFGLTMSLLSKGTTLDLIGSDELDLVEFKHRPGLNFLNLRGSQRPDASFLRKCSRVVTYYARLIRYAVTAEPAIFHILWNNKFEFFDRTLLMLGYKLLSRKIILTAHNVNAAKRDCKDTLINRLTLRIQYRLADHIFVHTQGMKRELVEDFGVRGSRVTIIPFGINNSVPKSSLTPTEAKQRLGILEGERTILFFGRIAPYKGLEYLIAAFRETLSRHNEYRLIIAGRVDQCEAYWRAIQESLHHEVQKKRVVLRAEFVPDDETEVYFKAADVLVLPYKDIFQSGVLFLGQSFGLPVIAADVGSLRDDIIEGKTGFLFRPQDPIDLGQTIERYFASDLYTELDRRRRDIYEHATERHSWDVVARLTMTVYADLLQVPGAAPVDPETLGTRLDIKGPS